MVEAAGADAEVDAGCCGAHAATFVSNVLADLERISHRTVSPIAAKSRGTGHGARRVTPHTVRGDGDRSEGKANFARSQMACSERRTVITKQSGLLRKSLFTASS